MNSTQTGWIKSEKGKIWRRQYEKNHRAQRSEYMKRWRAINRTRQNELAKNYRKNHKMEVTARNRLNSAVKFGKITKGSTCAYCSTSSEIEAHHHKGYENPLEVIWICRSCHIKAHPKQ